MGEYKSRRTKVCVLHFTSTHDGAITENSISNFDICKSKQCCERFRMLKKYDQPTDNLSIFWMVWMDEKQACNVPQITFAGGWNSIFGFHFHFHWQLMPVWEGDRAFHFHLISPIHHFQFCYRAFHGLYLIPWHLAARFQGLKGVFSMPCWKIYLAISCSFIIFLRSYILKSPS